MNSESPPMYCGFNQQQALKLLQDGKTNTQQATGNNVASAAGLAKKYLWPNGSTLKIYFMQAPDTQVTWNDRWLRSKEEYNLPDSAFDPLYFKLYNKEFNFRKLVHILLKERIAPLVHLRFEFTDNIEESDLRFSYTLKKKYYAGLAYFPYIVLEKNMQNEKSEFTLEISVMFDIVTFLHEMGHQLGMIHEHVQPNILSELNPEVWEQCADPAEAFSLQTDELTYALGGTFLVDPENRKESSWWKSRIPKTFEELKQVKVPVSLNAHTYDPSSIMHYPMEAFGSCERKIIPSMDEYEKKYPYEEYRKEMRAKGKLPGRDDYLKRRENLIDIPLFKNSSIRRPMKLSEGDKVWLKESYPGQSLGVGDLPNRMLPLWLLIQMVVLAILVIAVLGKIFR